MTTDGVRELFERWIDAVNRQDFAAMKSMIHADYIDEMPQSGERTRGAENAMAIAANYPGLETVQDGFTDAQLHRADDRWLITPGFAAVKVVGSNDVYTVTARVRYPDGSHWHVVVLARLKDGLIYRTTTYYAPEFPAPDWRSQWVERMDRPD
jgi:hypothetical protein